jgi:hypothetical protein
MGMSEARYIYATYSHDNGFLRFRPRLALRDLDDAMYLPYLNASLANKLKAIHVVANGYKLAEIKSDEMRIDPGRIDVDIPATSTEHELSDPWVRIRGDIISSFRPDFSRWTPRRRFLSLDVPDLKVT